LKLISFPITLTIYSKYLCSIRLFFLFLFKHILDCIRINDPRGTSNNCNTEYNIVSHTNQTYKLLKYAGYTSHLYVSICYKNDLLQYFIYLSTIVCTVSCYRMKIYNYSRPKKIIPVYGGDTGHVLLITDGVSEQLVSDLPREHRRVLPLVFTYSVDDLRRRNLRFRPPDHPRPYWTRLIVSVGVI